MWDSDEEMAMLVMHMLEDEVHHPWQMLRTLVKEAPLHFHGASGVFDDRSVC